jgi:membrane-bound serine protease (ClpP class)
VAVKSRRRPVVSGREELAGGAGEVLADFSGEGWARVHGETWRVRSAVPLTSGQRVRVTGIDGLTLDVEPQPDETNAGTR